MYASGIDIAENARKGVAALLKAQGAGLIDLKRSRKHARRNVRGPHVVALHEMLDRLEADLSAHVDGIAERITALGGTASGSVQAVATVTSLAPFPGDLFDGLRMVEALANRTASDAASVRKEIDETAGMGDADAAHLLTPLSRALDMSLWRGEAHLQRG